MHILFKELQSEHRPHDFDVLRNAGQPKIMYEKVYATLQLRTPDEYMNILLSADIP